MVDPFSNASSQGGQPPCLLFRTLHPDLPGIKADGVAQHWAIDYDVQVILMGLVLETGSATIADLQVALPGHPAPVAAIMALVDAGHLTRAPGALTPFTVISCGRDIESKSGPRVEGNKGPPPSNGPSASKTLIAFPTRRSERRDTFSQSVGADTPKRELLSRLLKALAGRQKWSRGRALVSGAAS